MSDKNLNAHPATGDFGIVTIQPHEPRDAAELVAMHTAAWAIADQAACDGARLLVLPEYFNAMGLSPEQVRVEATRTDRFHAAARELCRRRSCWLVLPLIECRGGAWLNTAHLYSPAGECVFTYDKTHITESERDVYGLTPGDKLGVAQTPFGCLGIVICYDIYFPEVARALALQGAQILVFPSLQRSDTPERCMLLNRSRAVDSQAFLVRSSYGQPPDTPHERGRCYGGSCVIAPDGTVLADAGLYGQAAEASVDPQWQWSRPTCGGMPPKSVREFLSADRRPELYGLIGDNGTDERSLGQGRVPGEPRTK